MIHLDKLKSLKRAYVHANCPDGTASALILKDALPDLEVHFVKYDSAEHREIEPLPNTIFCDFSPYIGKGEINREPGSVLDHWIQEEVIVLDHHSRDVVEPYPFGVFGENDKLECGAMLAYREVWQAIWCPRPFKEHPHPQHRVARLARLAAIRDTWKRDDLDFELACRQASVLMFFRFEQLTIDGVFDLQETLAPRLFERQIELAETCIKEAFPIVSEKGTRVLMFQGVSATSDAAEILERNFKKATKPLMGLIANRAFPPPNPDLVVGFHYRSDGGTLKLQFSTRSHTGFDCQAFAQAHGGNGHKAAAGFTVGADPSCDPYFQFGTLLSNYEAKL